MSIVEMPMRIIQKLGPARIWALEDQLSARPGAIRAVAGSPERFEIVAEAMLRGYRPPASAQALPHVMASLFGIWRSLRSVEGNPAQPRDHIPEAERLALEAYAHSVGVDDIGYARLAPELVFQSKAVLHENAIVLTMEMDRGRIDTSPSEASYVEVHATYHHLGRAANQIAAWLRKRGFSAQAGHPLNGLALYPPLAQQAGLGWRGLHGLLITPRFGPRVRLAAVFTSVGNLPFSQENDHEWIEGYCRRCMLCVRACPPQAILETPLARDNGLLTCIDSERCFPYFVEQYGCSICIRACPFHKGDYDRLRKHFSRA